MVKDMIHTMVETNLTEDTLNFKLNKLKPSTHYTFEVYALTEVGKGKVSKATIQSGVEPVLPSPPTRLAVSNIGKEHAEKRIPEIDFTKFLHKNFVKYKKNHFHEIFLKKFTRKYLRTYTCLLFPSIL